MWTKQVSKTVYNIGYIKSGKDRKLKLDASFKIAGVLLHQLRRCSHVKATAISVSREEPQTVLVSLKPDKVGEGLQQVFGHLASNGYLDEETPIATNAEAVIKQSLHDQILGLERPTEDLMLFETTEKPKYKMKVTSGKNSQPMLKATLAA